MTIDPDHPVQSLLFCYSNEVSDYDVEEMHSLVDRLAGGRSWIIGPPEFVDFTENPEGDNEEDQPVRTVGGVARLYSALPPWGNKLPNDIDRAHFDEVSFVINCLCDLSARRNQEITLELDQDELGWIKQGEPDHRLRVGLLDELSKKLEQ